MKKYLNIKTILLVISILVIIAGAISIYLNGFEKSIDYKAGTKIEVAIPKGYDKQEIITLAKECFNTDEVLFVEIEKTNQVAGVKVIEYTKEQLKEYIRQISKKYDMDEEKVEYHEVVVPETKITTTIKPYILPLVFTTTLSLIYIIIKNYKSNEGIKMPLNVLKILVITLGLYFSFIALFRLQFGVYTLPFALAIYIVDILFATNKR